MSKLIPNAFQCPNAYIDDLMQYLTSDEFKVLMFAIRHIFGWHDVIAHRQNRISLSVFENGFTTKTGNYFAGTGLSRPVITNALKQLTRYKILQANGKANQDGTLWRINENPDYTGLMSRAVERSRINQGRIEKAAMASKQKRLGSTSDVLAGSTVHVPEVGSSDVLAGSTVHVPEVGSSDVHIQSQKAKESQKEPPRPQIFEAYESAFGMTINSLVMAQELKDLEATYSYEWMIAAFKEAVLNNARNLKYVTKILERWQRDGHDTPKPHAQKREITPEQNAVANAAWERAKAEAAVERKAALQESRERKEREARIHQES